MKKFMKHILLILLVLNSSIVYGQKIKNKKTYTTRVVVYNKSDNSIYSKQLKKKGGIYNYTILDTTEAEMKLIARGKKVITLPKSDYKIAPKDGKLFYDFIATIHTSQSIYKGKIKAENESTILLDLGRKNYVSIDKATITYRRNRCETKKGYINTSVKVDNRRRIRGEVYFKDSTYTYLKDDTGDLEKIQNKFLYRYEYSEYYRRKRIVGFNQNNYVFIGASYPILLPSWNIDVLITQRNNYVFGATAGYFFGLNTSLYSGVVLPWNHIIKVECGTFVFSWEDNFIPYGGAVYSTGYHFPLYLETGLFWTGAENLGIGLKLNIGLRF